ncbi:MAG TPA: hypothetical protein VMW27_05815 [Thermoanaerobaculia bacterium]|nr:hypothetical protein [Thermoanaerobaculia bacterium]
MEYQVNCQASMADEAQASDQFRFLDEDELSTSAELSETTKCE